MEVFKVFATLSLSDMISAPLRAIKKGVGAVGNAVTGLGNRMGRLALAMAPLAIAGGVVLGSFGACVGVAAAFEDSMAKVGAVSRATTEEMVELEKAARHYGATTKFTASQVADAEMYLAMAGFTAKQNIAALPGVLNLAAASGTELGRASDIASDILSAFGLQAEEMTRVADVLALTCATANTNVELLGDTMKYVGPVARNAGMSLEEAAAMAGLLGNVGIKGSMAGTSLKAMINKIAAPAGEAQKVLKDLGVTVKDSAGNLRSPITILGEMSKKLETMGTAQQIAALKTIVGEDAIAGFAELINQEGVGAITKYVEQLQNAEGASAEMARRMGDTLGGSIRNMGSAWESLQISIGKLFLPVLRKVVDAITAVIGVFDRLAQSPVGQFFIKLLATLSAAAIAITGLSAGIWAFTKFAPMLLSMFAPLKGAILALGWPILLIIGAVSLLYLAWKKNFGGIQDILKRWWKNISTVVKGVVAIFKSLTGSTFEIRGELAKDIKAAGLENLVVNIAKIIHRIKAFFKGVWDGLDFSKPLKVLEPVGAKIVAILDHIGGIFARLTGTEVTSATDSFTNFGQIVGGILTWALEALATVVNAVVNGFSIMIDMFDWLICLITGDFAGAAAAGERIWNSLLDTLMSFLDLFRIGDWCREAWADAQNFLSSINLFESGAAILETLKDGIVSKFAEVKESVIGFFSSIREYLPFSDAKKGPFSDLTLSGSRFMTTLGEGMEDGSKSLDGTVSGIFSDVSSLFLGGLDGGIAGLQEKISGALQTVTGKLGYWWDGLFRDTSPTLPSIDPVQVDDAPARNAQDQRTKEKLHQAKQDVTIHIGKIELPSVKDGQNFVQSLRNVVTEYGGQPV